MVEHPLLGGELVAIWCRGFGSELRGKGRKAGTIVAGLEWVDWRGGLLSAFVCFRLLFAFFFCSGRKAGTIVAGLEWVDWRGGCLLSSFVCTGFFYGGLQRSNSNCETDTVEYTYYEAKKRKLRHSNSKTPRAIDDL